MIKNLWNKIVLCCGNHKGEEVIMDLKEGPSSLFYSCPKYYPQNRENGERACANRLNLIDFEKMLDHLSDKLMDDEKNGVRSDLSNYSFKNKKGMIFRIISYSENEIKVEMLNQRALK